jgi:hypothetical protein
VFQEFRHLASRRFSRPHPLVPHSLQNISLKSEVLYLAFGENSTSFNSPFNGNTPFTVKTDDSVWVSRIGLNVRF